MNPDAPATELVDGEPGGAIAPDDRGLAFGDGVFETVVVIGGRPALWAEHLARLEAGCHALGFSTPTRDELARDADRLFPAEDGGCGILKLIVTRGGGGRGYAPPADPRPRRIALRRELPSLPRCWWRDGVALHLCRTRIADRPVLAGLKHLNRLPQVMARSEWGTADGFAEGLMVSDSGDPVECTASNLFVRRDGRLITPPRGRLAVAGVMRARVLALAVSRGLDVAERPLTWRDLTAANEVFVTNSIVGILSVRTMTDHRWPSGPLARILLGDLIAEGAVVDWLRGETASCED